MEKTKANFRAIREIVGLSQSDVARLTGVSTTAVKRWEHPDGPQPPQDAWEELLQWFKNHRTSIRYAVEAAINSQEKTGRMPNVALPYWRSQADYDRAGRDPGIYSVINARCRAVAQELERYGFEVEFIEPEQRGPERF